MHKISILKQIAVFLFCVATVSFSSQPSGGSAGSLKAATATAAAVATATAHNADSKTLKDVVENAGVILLRGRPAHCAFSPSGKAFVVVNSEGNRPVQAFEIDGATGVLTPTEREFPTVKRPKNVFYLSRDDFFLINQNDKLLTLHNSSDTVRKVLFDVREETISLINSVSVCSSKDLIAITSSDGDSFNSFVIYRFDFEKQALIPLANSPFKIGIPLIEKVFFSPSGNLIAVTGFDGSGFAMRFYAFDSAKVTLTPIKGSPIEVLFGSHITFSPDDSCCFIARDARRHIRVLTLDRIHGIKEQHRYPMHELLTAIAVSPDGKFLLEVDGYSSPGITVHAVDHTMKTIRPVADASVPAKPYSMFVVYSPLGDQAVALSSRSRSMSLYEVDRATGKFTPLTGGLLQSELARRAMVLAREVLVDHGPLVHGIIARYLGAIYDNAPAAASIEEVTEADGAIAKTKEESDSKRIQETRVQLFDAITKARSDDIAQLLTPFTINARDEESRTALMHAVRHSDTDSIVEQLLKYKGEKQYSLHSKEAVEVDLNAVDYDGNTALIYAIKNNRFKAACTLAQKMSKEIIAKANKKKETALSLAQEEKVRAKYAGDEYYEKLVSLLDDKKEAVGKIKEENKPEQVIEVVAK